MAEGRDITTVVAPEAPVRVLLVADPAARVARRHAELGEHVDADAVHRPGGPARPRRLDGGRVPRRRPRGDGARLDRPHPGAGRRRHLRARPRRVRAHCWAPLRSAARCALTLRLLPSSNDGKACRPRPVVQAEARAGRVAPTTLEDRASPRPGGGETPQPHRSDMTETTTEAPVPPPPPPAPCPSSPWSVAPTSASPPWSTASSAAARRSSRTSRASPATGSPTTPTGTAGSSSSSTPAAGRPTPRGWPRRSPSRPSWPSPRPTPSCFVVDAHRRHAGRRPGRRPGAAPQQEAGRARREQGRRPARRGRGRDACGTWGSASPTRSPPCTGGGAATCSTRSSTALPAAPARSTTTRARTAPGGDRRQAQRRQVQPAQQGRRASSAWSSTTWPARPSTPSTSWSRSTARPTVFIDTAGIRRRVKEASGHEYYASLRTHGAIERAEVCVVVLDASEPLTEQDLRILTVGRGGRPRAGHRLQQVGPDRRGAPPLPRPRDRARPRRTSPGRRTSTSPRRPAGTSTGSARRCRRR